MITRTEFISKWKVHLVFGGGFLFAIAFSAAMNMVGGEHFSKAAWHAVREIRPVEVLMLIGFWYTCAFYRPKDAWSTSLTTLNLSGKDEGRP